MSGQAQCQDGETIPQIPLSRLFLQYIFPETKRHQSDAGLQYVFVEQMHNAHMQEGWQAIRKIFTPEQTCLSFFGCGDEGFFHRDKCYTFSVTHVLTHGSSHDYLCRESWALFRPLLKILAHADIIIFLDQHQLAGHEFGSNPTCVQIIFQYDPQWPYSMCVSNYKDSIYSVSEAKLLPLIHIFKCFGSQCLSPKFNILNRGHVTSERGTKLLLFQLPAPQMLVNIFNVSVAFFPILSSFPLSRNF